MDIYTQRSKHIDAVQEVDFDYVVTVCEHAAERYPTFAGGAEVIHLAFDDPPPLATAARTAAEGLAQYRRVRDEIGDYVVALVHRLTGPAAGPR